MSKNHEAFDFTLDYNYVDSGVADGAQDSFNLGAQPENFGIIFSEATKELVQNCASQFRGILEASSYIDTHTRVPDVVARLVKGLQADQEIPSAIKEGMVELAKSLIYDHANTISPARIKSDLEMVANKLEEIVSY